MKIPGIEKYYFDSSQNDRKRSGLSSASLTSSQILLVAIYPFANEFLKPFKNMYKEQRTHSIQQIHQGNT